MMAEMASDLPWIDLGAHLRVNVPDADAACSEARRNIVRGTGFSMATLNLDHAVHLDQPGPFRDAYAAHSHITAAGMPIAWLARRAGVPINRVTGADLVIPFARIAAEANASVGLIGATAKVLNRAAAALSKTCPGVTVALRISPSFPFDPFGPEAASMISRIGESGTRMCFLALGAPRQEILAARIFAARPDMGVISVGAGIDFIAGTVRRAPGIFQKSCLEWLWRVAHEPRRLGPRYWRCARQLPRLVADARPHDAAHYWLGAASEPAGP